MLIPQSPKGVHGVVSTVPQFQHLEARGEAGQIGQRDGWFGPIGRGKLAGIPPDDEREQN